MVPGVEVIPVIADFPDGFSGEVVVTIRVI